MKNHNANFRTVLCSSSGKSVNEREKDVGDKEEDEKKKKGEKPRDKRGKD